MAKYIAIIAAAALGCVVAFYPSQGFARTEPVYTGIFSNVAVSGYDPVAYFTTGRPVKGSTAYKVIHKGAEYHFANAANLAKFKANPSAYTPQYGGYCAWAVSQGYTASGDPTVWKIVNGKLYLNYNREVGTKWQKNIPGHIRSANTNWPKLLAE
jgi:YHS domain-containing protein